MIGLLERIVTRRGRALLASIAVAVAACAAGWAQVGWTQDPDVITLEGSDELEFYRGYLGRWGSDELIVIAYAVDDAFAPPALSTLRALTDALLDLEHVRWVWSLDTAFRVAVGPMGPYARPLVPDRVDADPDLREHALASPFVRDALVSHDGRTLVLSVQLEGTQLGERAAAERTLDAIDAILARPEFAGLDAHLAGSPVFNRELSRMNRRDNALFTPLAVGIVAALVALLFRSLLATAAVMAVVGATVACTLGAMGWLGVPMNITTSLLSPLLMVIAVADSVHLASAYLGRLGAGDDRAGALRWTLREVVPPCFWTSLTTAFGFAALGLVRIESVRTFGAFAVLGVLVAFALSVTLLPALMLRLPLEGTARPMRVWQTASRPTLALVLGAAALALAAVGLPRVEVATHDGEFFSAGHPLNRAYRFIEARLQGVTPFEIEILAPEDGALRRASAVRAVAAMQASLAAIPEVTAGLSYVSLLESTSPGLDLADDAAVERALFLLETLAPDDLSTWIDAGHRRARISARADAMTSARSTRLLEQVGAIAAQVFPPDWQVRPTGLVPVFALMEQYLVEGQLRSYAFALAAIGLAFACIFRSLRVALVALVPNLLAVAVCGGAMGLAGIRLDVATVMVSSVALGIIVDDTIHLTTAYLRGLESGAAPPDALTRALAVAGRPVLFTSLILAGGFAALCLSDFRPTAHFGGLVGLTVLTALVADLVVLPAALVHLGPAARPSLQHRTEEITP